jgi:quercetin dioxygenase-like cupin family protein
MSMQAQSFLDTDSIPWIPLGPGESFKPLRFLARDGGRVLLLRLEPGTLVPRHRHLGEVHAFNLAGSRLLIETGQVVGPGGYVYEPAGNVDSWKAVGGAPVVVQIVAYGAMEYLDESGEVLQRDTHSSLLDAYLRYCRDNGLVPADLGGAAGGLAGPGPSSSAARSRSGS